MNDRGIPRGAIPESWRGDLTAQLDHGESVLAWFQPDLDATLRYDEGLVVLTDRRVLVGELRAGRKFRSWPLDALSALRLRERAGLGTLELVGPAGRLTFLRFTVSRGGGAHRVVERFDAFRRDGRIEVDLLPETVCPSCGAVRPGEVDECPACAADLVPAPVRRGLSRYFDAKAPLVRLVWFARNRVGMIVLGLVLSVAGTGAGLIWPYLTMMLMDDFLSPHQEWLREHPGLPWTQSPVNFGPVPWYLLGLFGSAVLAWVLLWWRTYVLGWVSERISADLRNRTYEHLHRLSLEYFGGKRTGDLIARISSDTERICDYLSINLLDFITDVLTIIGTAVVMLAINLPLALAALVPLPLIVWLVLQVRGRLKRGFARGRRAWGEMTSVLADAIPGIRVVKAFAQESREVGRFRESNNRVLQANDRVNTLWAFCGPIINLTTQLGLLVVWAVAIGLIMRGYLKVGVLIAFVTYISRIYIRLESMSRMVQATQRASASVYRLFEILDRAPSVAEPSNPVAIDKPRGAIEFRGVSFRYGNRTVIHDLDLAIQPGEMIGLVGASGAGKSTLVNLVCRFYDVSEGAILVDGTDVRSYRVEDYRRHIGIVLQEPFLFFGSVAENIAYGRPDATRAEIVQAAKAARAHEFILRLADGYDSMVGERGQSLSGGERQRISIARALLIDPRILILDEATSSVDTETEREIQEALDNLIQGRTTIAIAHRLSTLRKADRLVVLDRGRIAEVGPQDELLKNPGAYSRLHRAQIELALGTTVPG